MKLRVTHSTRYTYTPAVETAQHMAYLQPRTSAEQQLLQHALHIQPEAQRHTTEDVYGNHRVFFSLQTPHTTLEIVACSVVATAAARSFESDIAWEQVRESFRYQSRRTYDQASEFVFASPFVPRHADFAAYARPSFTQGASVVEASADLMRRIHREFQYQSQSTDVNTPAVQALRQRKGVCQDFAHVLIACLRAMGLAARYVSGYVLTHAPEGGVKLIGGDASHAWGSVYVPDVQGQGRWLDLDPTNDRVGWDSPGEDYITLALGRDFGDVSPVRGVIHGGASHVLTVGVTVEQLDPPLDDTGSSQSTGASSQSQSQS